MEVFRRALAVADRRPAAASCCLCCCAKHKEKKKGGAEAEADGQLKRWRWWWCLVRMKGTAEKEKEKKQGRKPKRKKTRPRRKKGFCLKGNFYWQITTLVPQIFHCYIYFNLHHKKKSHQIPIYTNLIISQNTIYSL